MTIEKKKAALDASVSYLSLFIHPDLISLSSRRTNVPIRFLHMRLNCIGICYELHHHQVISKLRVSMLILA